MTKRSSVQISDRKKRIQDWFKKKENLLLVGVVFFALIIRIHYFLLTMHQPLWWDEAEYLLKAKNIALGTPDTGWAGAIRPILFPLFASGFFALGLGETPLRFLLVLISCAEIGLLFLLGKELFNKKVGFIAAFLMSVFYIDIFYTTRLLVDVPQVAFVTLAGFLFTRYAFGDAPKKIAWFILPIIFIGIQIRFTVGLYALILFVFLISTEGMRMFMKKEWYVSLGIALLLFLPYLLYVTISFGNPFYTIGQGLSSANSERGEGVSAIDIFMQYVRYLPSYTPLVFFVAFLLGTGVLLFNMGIGLDKIRSNRSLQKYLFLFLWAIIPLLYFGFFVNHFEDRYLFMSFPAIFLITALAFDSIYVFGTKYNRAITALAILILLSYGAWSSIQRTDDLIKSRVTSYEDLRQAGLWIKERSAQNDSIISAGMPEITYYSERRTYPFPINQTEFTSESLQAKNAQFIILSSWERSPEWAYRWPEENRERVTVEKVFFSDLAKKQPSTIIYRLKN